jgi:hypothetical protein
VRRPESQSKLPLYEAAKMRSDGCAVEPKAVRTPLKVVFQPTEDARSRYQAAAEGDVRLALKSEIPAGTPLYDVMAGGNADDDGSELVAVGQLVTDSAFVASEYGDERLFFQHMRHRRA